MDWLGTVVGFIVGVISTIATERLNLWLNRPGIRIDFTNDEQCLRVSNAQVNDGTRVFMTESKFLRIGVTNTRGHSAKGCRCFITSIKKKRENGSELLLLADTLPLRWAYLGFDPIDLPPGTHLYADIISTLQDQDYFTLQSEIQPFVLANVTKDLGRYTFDVSVVGDNFDPVRVRIFLEWKGDWNFSDVWSENLKS